MKPKVKVCGMRDPLNIQGVSELEPDFIGFIFYEKSPRFVGPGLKIPDINKKIKRVGVFVNHGVDFIAGQSAKFGFEYVQLHGNEPPSLCIQLKDRGLKVIKAVSIDSRIDFEAAAQYVECIDYFLFDTKSPSYGGTGKTFSWSLLKSYGLAVPFFLSGGLNPDNIDEAFSIDNEFLYALDLNSGFEIAPGKKDILKLKTVFNQLNQQSAV